MNSSVTWDSDTSVMSSLCLEISPSSRSNGPSKTSRCTSKAPVPACGSSDSACGIIIFIVIHASPDAADHEAAGVVRVQVGEEDRDRLPHQPPPVERDAQPPQVQPRVLKLEQLGGGQVDGDLLVVSFPAGRLTFIRDQRLGRRGAQKLCDPGD